MRPLTAVSRRNADRSAARNVTFATEVAEAVSLAREMRVFSVEGAVRDSVAVYADSVTAPYRNMRFLQFFTPALYQFLALLLACAGLGALYLLDPSGGAGFASIGVVALILVRSLSYGQQLQSVHHHLNEVAPYVREVAAEHRRYLDAEERWGDAPLEAIGRVELDRVVYAYEPGRPVLHGIDLTVEPGETLGIVGPSGGGKSTVSQLVLGLRRPTSGTVRVGGRDLHGFRRGDFYRRVAFVPQDSTVFDGTVHDNIQFFRQGFDRADVERAAKRAHLHDEIQALPQGYDTPVSDSRGALSGGQRQRLFIARALLGAPELLVLDEPTSALDLKSDALVQETLESLRGQVTMVIIAHRLSTLRFCDRLVVIRGGRIEASGDARALESDSAFYREAVELSELA
jgi:ABC-type multidrug transport system fused ATPase/permease subunit